VSPAERQLVENAPAPMTDARVLVMDQPTSSLGLADIEQLLGLIEHLRAGTVVYISHFLEEVQRVTQRYTVLHDGRNVGSGLIADVTLTRLGRADDRPAAKVRWSEPWRVRRTER
jgi:ribose transport system ATP-binding protein